MVARDPYEGLLEPAAAARPLRRRRMFGCWAYYVEDGAQEGTLDRLVWVSASRREPWRGILVPTERAHHDALRAALPRLRVHPVLGKWLYLAARDPEFESVADELARRIADGDPLIGVTPNAAPSRRRGGRVP